MQVAHAFKFLYLAAIAAYLASLCLPGIVYEASILTNPKYQEGCAYATKPNVACSSFSFGRGGWQECGVKEFMGPGKEFVDKDQIIQYCTRWDKLVSSSDLGFVILGMGFLGFFFGTIAWFANPLGLLAFLAARIAFHKTGLALSVLAFIVGFDAFGFREKWLDEGGVNKIRVDHLGPGYYVWEASLAILAAYCLVRAIGARKFDQAARSPAPP